MDACKRAQRGKIVELRSWTDVSNGQLWFLWYEGGASGPCRLVFKHKHEHYEIDVAQRVELVDLTDQQVGLLLDRARGAEDAASP